MVTSAGEVNGTLPTLAAYDTSALPQLAQAIDRFGRAIIDSPVSPCHLREAALHTERFTVYSDLFDFADHIEKSKHIDDACLKQAAADVKKVIASVVIAEEHGTKAPNAHGLTIDVLTPFMLYKRLDLSKDTCWHKAMEKLRRPR